MRTSGNTVLITGGGSGIGLALTEELARRGNQVIICGRRRNPLRAAQARVPGIQSRVCDISKARSRQALVGWVLSEFKQLNVLVNNAGIHSWSLCLRHQLRNTSVRVFEVAPLPWSPPNWQEDATGVGMLNT